LLGQGGRLVGERHVDGGMTRLVSLCVASSPDLSRHFQKHISRDAVTLSLNFSLGFD
jgi:hypothetical protein